MIKLDQTVQIIKIGNLSKNNKTVKFGQKITVQF